MDAQNARIGMMLNLFEDDFFSDPAVCCFHQDEKSFFESVKIILKDKQYKLVDVNQALTINPEDFNMPISKIGFKGPTGKETVNEVLCSVDEKKKLITMGKLEEIKAGIDANTVLVVEYNEQVLNNQTFYNTVRIMLKDGVDSRRNIKAIVYVATTKNFRDFCLYGTF